MKLPLSAALFALFFLDAPIVRAQTPPAPLPVLQFQDIKATTPSALLLRAVAAGDLRFLGVPGYGLTIPGVSSETLVKTKGNNRVEVTDYAGDDGSQMDKNLVIAEQFAAKYNRLLLAHLEAVNDADYQHVVGEIDKVLRQMERDNPLADAQLANKKGDSSVILVPGFGFPGIVKDANYEDWDFYIRILKAADDLMTPSQKVRLKKVVTRYVIPYNQAIQRHWNASRKKKKRG